MGKKAGKGGARNGSGTTDDDAALEAALEVAGAQRGRAEGLSRDGDDLAACADWAGAVRAYSEAIAIDPNNGLHYCKRSTAHLGAGRISEAVADAKVAAGLGGLTSEDSAYCHCQMGFVLVRDGQLQAAREAYERGLRLCPKHAGCLQGVEEVVVLLERRGGARPPPMPAPGDAEAQLLLTLPAPEEVLGKGFEVVHLKVGGCERLFSFLISTTLTSEAVITPAACGLAGIKIQRTVDVPDVSFEGGAPVGMLQGCIVTNFVQAQVAQQALGAVLDGMLGLPFLQQYDFYLDRVRSEQRFRPADALADAGSRSRAGALQLPSINLPGSLLGIPVELHLGRKHQTKAVGIMDTGSMFSIMNWQAAKELGISSPDDPALRNATKVAGASRDGVIEMPLVSLKVHICSAQSDFGCRLGGISKEEFDAEGKFHGWSVDLSGKDVKPCAEFGAVNAAIGDALQFGLLTDSVIGEFTGPAVLLGQDLLAQAPRLAVSAKSRRISVDPPGRVIDAVPV